MPRAILLIACLLAGIFPAAAQDVLRGHGGPVRALAIGSDGRTLVSGSFDTAVIVWDLQRNTAQRVLRFHDGPVSAVAHLADGCLATAGDDRRIAVWCGTGSTPRHVLTGHEGPVTALLRHDAGFISAGHDGTVRQWTLAVPSVPRRIAEYKSPVTAMALGGQGNQLLVATGDGRVRLLTISATTADERRSAVFPTAIGGLAMASNGREIVAAAADGHIRLLSLDLAEIAAIEVDRIPLSSLALSPDGRIIATAGLRGGIAIINRDSRKILHRLTGPGLPVWSLAFDADSRTLLSGGADRVIRRWDAVAGMALTSTVPERDVVAEAAAGGERGAVVFRACQACHTLGPDDGNRAGPTLHGILGRRIGTARDYAYSDALRGMRIVWSKETIARLFEIGPAAYTPGTKMPEQTIDDPADRKALVDWLERVTAAR